jgi:anti-sigma factor RsiW
LNCHEIHALLPGYVDGALDLVRSLEIEDHLHECPTCAREVQGQKALRAALQDPSFYHRPGAHLAQRVRSALRRASRPRLALPARAWRLLAVAASLAFVALISWALVRGLFVPSANDLLAREVVSSHVRSLVAVHPVDKESSNRHQVKPWLTERLDFAVPVVKNLTDRGFRLIGGRVDYLDNRKVAALVYKRRGHHINLFIWPAAADAESAAQALTYRGFDLIHWTSGGFHFWAISDMDKNGLREFVRDFRN